MPDLFSILIVFAMVATLASLLGGVVVMARGRGDDARRAQLLMRWRVGLQGLALVLFALAFLVG